VDQAIAAYDKAIALDPKHEGQGKTNHLVSKETRREFKKQQGIGSN